MYVVGRPAMTEPGRGAPEGETPVNPYSLLEAVNNSSDTAHTAWLIFLAIMTYFMIAVAGVTHKDFLLETPVELPVLQVKIQLAQFFQFAPIILVLLHVGVVSQLVLLARKTLELDHAIRMLEMSDRRTHPLRLELHNFFFVQAIAGPHRSTVMSTFLHGMSWLTLVILPVILILYIQVVFLPYHDVAITWTHRIALVADLAMLVLIGVFLMRAETSFFQAFWRTTIAHPTSFGVTASVLGLVAFFSFFVATIPGELLDRVAQAALNGSEESEGGERHYVSGFSLPFSAVRADGSLFGVFRRNLDVTDSDLVVDKDVTAGEPSINLRGRDLRYARLDRSDLHQADLTGADLSEASLVGTDLRDSWMQCADLNELLLSEDREAAKCTTARRANFSRARLENAHMTGVDLGLAKLEEARLDAVELAYALLIGTNFSSAHLDKAYMTGGVQAQGANFLIASLQGTDLTGAQLQFADFSSAAMQGVLLAHAHMQSAILRDADLEAASASQVKLQGADMTGVRIAGADLRGAGIWLTAPPQGDTSGLLELADVVIRPLDDGEVGGLTRAIERIDNRRVRRRVKEALTPLMNAAESRKWEISPDYQRWQSLIAAAQPSQQPEIFKARLTDYLTQLVCKARWSSGGLATGIARRAQTPQFRGDIVAVYDRLKAADCPSSKTVPARVLRDFGAAADLVRGN